MHVAETLSPTTYYIGLLLLLSVLLVVCQLSSIDRCCWHSLLRVEPNANPPSELLRGQRLRKQAILELFERTQVTMTVTKDDIHGGKGCIEDVLESGSDAVGILKVSRPAITTSSNPTPEDACSIPFPPAAVPSPPDGCDDVPNLCAICLDSYVPGQCVAWSSGCRHVFHQECISHYLAIKMVKGETPCPSCRQKFCDITHFTFR